MLNLAIYTGCRFGDLVHAKWGNVIYEKTPAGVETVKIRLTLSKGDVFNRRDDVKIFRINSKDPFNPVHKLLSIYYEAPAKDGFIFEANSVKKRYFSTADLVYHMQAASRECGYKTKYTGHSARNALVSTLALAGASAEQLRIFLNWCGDSAMVHTYKRNNLENSNFGCANLVNEIISSGAIFKLQDNFMF